MVAAMDLEREEMPVWSDDESPEPTVAPELPPAPAVRRCCHCPEPVAEGHAFLCAAHLAEDVAREASRSTPCESCGEPRGRDYDTPLCRGCEERERRDRAAAEMARHAQERVERLQREYAESPHHCIGAGGVGCSTKMLVAGARCRACWEVHERRQERAAVIRRTVRGLPLRYKWCAFGAPELRERVHDAEAIAKVQAAVERGADRILLTGDRAGVGKTVLAACALVAYAAQHGVCS
jgi:hypothetical protein